jgi:hypothetical protein
MSQPFLDAGLARRLAEAADCFRDGKYHYFICRTAPPYDLNYTRGYDSDFDANKDALQAKTELGTEYEIFGPYKTELKEAPTFDYDSIQLGFFKNQQLVYTQTFDGDVDALILSMSAFDKFLLPYYLRLYDIQIASEMRTQAANGLMSSPMQALSHVHGKDSSIPPNAVKKAGGTLLMASGTSLEAGKSTL